MFNPTRVVDAFPSVSIPSESGGLPVEVSLIAQLGHGAGDQIFAGIASRQRHHETFIDALDEPSAKLGGTNFAKGDATSLYSFTVGAKGHPFHRHAGHRIFTAVSGSGGAQLRFSTASDEQLVEDPQNFVRALRFVNIPPDCLFTVRFGGETWHQFFSLVENSSHPVFTALSCHTNELGGKLPDTLKQEVLANAASIPSLTQLLSEDVAAILQSKYFASSDVPSTTLSFDAPAGAIRRVVCDKVRGSVGRLRVFLAARLGGKGFLSFGGNSRKVEALSVKPLGSLLATQMADTTIHHDDTFRIRLTSASFKDTSATRLLASVLEGFLQNRVSGVSSLMALRNAMVKPFGLRTSPLGCPVSSLLSTDVSKLFTGQFPVIEQLVAANDKRAQVILGADDKHLIFRSCVGVELIDDHHVDITLGTRVHCKNLFGRFYMGVIDYVHRRYISPAILRAAVEYAVSQEYSVRSTGVMQKAALVTYQPVAA